MRRGNSGASQRHRGAHRDIRVDNGGIGIFVAL